MLAASSYYYVYLAVFTIITFVVMNSYSQVDLSDRYRQSSSQVFLAVLVTIFVVLFIGFRPISGVFVDMGGYAMQYNRMLGAHFFFNLDTENLIFDNIIPFMASKMIPINIFFLVIALVYFGCMFWACHRLFPQDTLLALLCCLVAFSTFTYGTNGIKAGMATSLFLLAVAYRDKLWISIPLAIFTLGIHHSMLLVIVAYFCVLFVKHPKWYFIIWALSFCAAALHITWFQHYFAGFTDEHGASYLLSSRNSGFRIDFIIYSAVPVIIGYWMIFKNNLYSRTYDIILNLYLLTNSVWMLCMYANFTNRIAYLSWFLYPVVLLYPFVNLCWSEEQNKYLKYVVYGHLGFTLFMTFIYY